MEWWKDRAPHPRMSPRKNTVTTRRSYGLRRRLPFVERLHRQTAVPICLWSTYGTDLQPSVGYYLTLMSLVT